MCEDNKENKKDYDSGLIPFWKYKSNCYRLRKSLKHKLKCSNCGMCIGENYKNKTPHYRIGFKE